MEGAQPLEARSTVEQVKKFGYETFVSAVVRALLPTPLALTVARVVKIYVTRLHTRAD